VAHDYHSLIRGEARGLWPSLQRGGLWTLSVPYGWATRVRNGLYDRGWKRSFQAPVPVVSVGNLTLGGTGKTPCVEYLARWFRRHGRRVAILSRGYGSRAGRNDEALVLAENLPDVPHLQGADRVTLARAAVEDLASEVLVLDDGFQHRRLARNLDLVLVDATAPWGHGSLFPRGLLRETPTALRRAGLVVLTRCDQVGRAALALLQEQVARFAPDVPVIATTHRPVALVNADRAERPLDELTRRPVGAFCGIGNPDAFRRTLTQLGASLGAFRAFPDHHEYGRADLDGLHAWAREHPPECLVVTTQKDLVKVRLARIGGRELWAVRVELQVADGRDTLEHRLEQVLSRTGQGVVQQALRGTAFPGRPTKCLLPAC
jgi:tetraacyldisaccharide 4'-kinase